MQAGREASVQVGGEGWLLFAGIALMVAGVMRFFDAIWAWTYSGPLPNNLQDSLYGRTLTSWGWVWLGVAVLLFFSGIGVMTRSQLARWIGVFAGAVGAISAIWWIAYYPIWSLVYIGVAMLVIYALLAYGGREVPSQM
jgi:hypothetical protein